MQGLGTFAGKSNEEELACMWAFVFVVLLFKVGGKDQIQGC